MPSRKLPEYELVGAVAADHADDVGELVLFRRRGSAASRTTASGAPPAPTPASPRRGGEALQVTIVSRHLFEADVNELLGDELSSPHRGRRESATAFHIVISQNADDALDFGAVDVRELGGPTNGREDEENNDE